MIACAALGVAGCTVGGSDSGEFETMTSAAATGSASGPSDTGTTGGGTTTGAPDEGSTTDGTGPSDTGTFFDLGAMPDAGRPDSPIIPETCAQASAGETSVGCLFYTVDLDNNVDSGVFGVAVSNVQQQIDANVTLERKAGGNWVTVEGPITVAALDLYQFELSDFHLEGTGINVGGAYRVTSDVPIIAYQFNPVDGASSALSDASMLYPVASWDDINSLVGWAAEGPGRPYVTIAAAFDGTVVSFNPSTATNGAAGVPATTPGNPIDILLNEGDAVSITPVEKTNQLTGSSILSDEDHPVAVFSGHTCANVPGGQCCCDHLEEQLAGVRLWGKSFVAPHMPIRDAANPEATMWQIYASEDGTTITLDGDPALTGLPAGNLMLQKGDVYEMFVTAPIGVEADFEVVADRPIAVMGYMIGSTNLGPGLQNEGDPSMIQFPPVEQFLPRYVVLVPSTWINDALVLTRAAGASIEIDGVPVPDSEFAPLPGAQWEAARISIPDGVHLLDGGVDPFGVVVIGWDDYDSYAYIGGTGTGTINPNPEG